MPELRMVSRTAVADRSAGRFFLRRVASPGAVAEKGAVEPLALRALSPSNNKENVPPLWAATTALKRRSSLPEWYPRTPLRDITAVIKAVERKRFLRDAAAWQQIQWTEDSPQSVDVPQQTEQDVVSAQAVVASTPQPTTNETVADAASTQAVVASTAATCLAEGVPKASDGYCSLQTPPRPSEPEALTDLMEKKLASSIEQVEKMVSRNTRRDPKASDGDCSLQTPSKPSETEALTDLMEKKLASSIEQIEKMVSRNTQRDPKAAQPCKNPAVQRRTLMSMR